MEKPLHVQVAEALGWTENTNDRTPFWYGRPPNGSAPRLGDAIRDGSGRYVVPNHDTDWSATGPLIERYRLLLSAEDGYCKNDGCQPGDCCDASCPCWEPSRWSASVAVEYANGPTALVAVCNLILALAKAGKLHAQESISA